METRYAKPDVKPDYVPDEEEVTKKYSINNPPKSDSEWAELFDANPNYAMELKAEVKKHSDSWHDKRNQALKKVQEKHPDMYKRDANGNFLRENGKLILDTDSPKAKVWMKIAGDDPKILEAATAPTIVMKAMELELKNEGEAEMKKKLDKEKEEKEKKRKTDADAAALADGGKNPPTKPDDIKVEYDSEEEKNHVQKAIARGTYKDEKEYMKIKKGGVKVPYGRGGF